MYGNPRGWILSAVVLIFTVCLIVTQGTMEPISRPSGKLPQGKEVAALPVDPKSLNITPGTKDCDAGDLYRQAADDALKHEMKYDHYQGKVKEARAANPPGVQALVEAAGCANATLFSKKPEEIVNYHNRQEVIEGLKTVGTLTSQIGLLYVAEKKYDQAKPFLNASFILGERLYEERLRFIEFIDGTDLMTSATGALARIAKETKDDARAAQLENFASEVSRYQSTKVQPLWAAISGVDKATSIGPYAGDMFDIALHGKDRMWRIEATLKVGRYRYNATRFGDQAGAKRVLTQMASDPTLDSAVKIAATAGRDLSQTDYNMIGGGS